MAGEWTFIDDGHDAVSLGRFEPASPARPGSTRWLARSLGAARRCGAAAAVAVVDVVYPPSCIHCASALGAPHGLCPACWRAMPLIEEPFCNRLGLPFAADLGPGLLSVAALADPPVFGRARAVARHEGPARVLVHRLKFGDRLELALPMGRWMARAGAVLLGEADAIVPVPLHPVRLWRRRANQAAALGVVVSKASGVSLQADWLLRSKATRPQVGLSRSERGLNLQGSFRVPAAAKPVLAGRRIVLVDDVLTTGATANACSRVLLRAGAASVDVLTFARVTLAS